MTKEQKLQVPAYIKDFLDKQDSLHHGLSEVFNTLQNIHMEWHDRCADDESKTTDKQFVVLAHTGTEYFDTEYLDKNFDEVDIVDAIKFNTKEEAEAFIVKQYTIKEVYADEN